jgi:hypothetical protein
MILSEKRELLTFCIVTQRNIGLNMLTRLSIRISIALNDTPIISVITDNYMTFFSFNFANLIIADLTGVTKMCARTGFCP